MNTFTYNGVSSKTYKCLVSGEDAWAKPAPDLEHVVVPGRNGDLIINNKRYQNVDVVYHCIIKKEFPANYQGLCTQLLKSPGYQRLEDSFHPDHYRMAVFDSSIEPEMLALNKHGTFDLKFSCKPQMWLKSGEAAITYTSGAYLTNPTLFTAKPLIRIYGSGDITIAGRTVHVTNSTYSYVDIDSELEECYYGANNCNAMVTLKTNNEFPTLSPGSNWIGLGSGISRVVLTPRWWTI